VIEVWTAAASDGVHVARLLAEFRDWMVEHEPTNAAIAASVERLMSDADTEYLLARADAADVPCGVCQLRYRHSVWTSTPDCWLEDLFVDEHVRGRGVGRALVQLAFERARARGAARIELDTNERNTGAIALYESLGFSTASKTHGAMDGRDIFLGRRLS
jgi:ribosomal protein S18 acetylase RimI-like enzyme